MRWRFLLLAGALALLAGNAEAVCNTNDGNIAYCVNYDAVDYGAIAVCFNATNISSTAVQWAFDGWNGVVGKDILGYNCAGLSTGIMIDDVADGDCGYTNGAPNPICARYPQHEYPVPLHIFATPGVRTYPLDGQEHLAKHELGHTLGFDHEDVCESVMAMVPDCDPNPVEPTAVDAENYGNAYWVEAVTGLTGLSLSPGTVSLNWGTVNSAGQELCNEKEFGVWRLDPGTGWYTIHIATAGQNATASEFGGEPPGSQSYRVWSMTDALSISAAGYAPVTVDVLGLRITRGLLFGPAPAVLSDAQGRYMWVIAEVQNHTGATQQAIVAADVTGRPPGCSQEEQLILPGYEQFSMAAGEEKWVLYRFRYECHSPAGRGTYPMDATLCMRRAGQSLDDSCLRQTRALIVS